jgi:hypothetical protein
MEGALERIRIPSSLTDCTDGNQDRSRAIVRQAKAGLSAGTARVGDAGRATAERRRYG